MAKIGVKKLTVFQRSPVWAPMKFDFEFSENIKKLFTWIPITKYFFRFYVFLLAEFGYQAIFLTDSFIAKVRDFHK